MSTRPHLLSGEPDVPEAVREKLRSDFERFGSGGLPADLEAYILDAYDLDVSASYAGFPLKNPWGKGSGQLSMRVNQVEEAAAAGLGFVVLKTVIAEDAAGDRSMAAWAIKEARMVVEPIVGRETGASGWTVTWKGRGWWQSFEDYLELVAGATAVGLASRMLVVPSVKYHLPSPDESEWRTGEYERTTRSILDAYASAAGPGPMPLEKDFSPTLAGSDRSRRREKILEWLSTVPPLIRRSAAPDHIAIGLKLFNALDDEDFQIDLLNAVHADGPGRPDFLVYANRLFDPDREFDGHRGVAYGGPDLSDRNLRALSRYRAEALRSPFPAEPLEISATGDICSGQMAVEYLLRGCSSFQIHTFFQLPLEIYPARHGGRLERALHSLYFDPSLGFIAWMLHAGSRLFPDGSRPIRLLDLAEMGLMLESQGVLS